jgi:DNA-binding response OmpR family regulator
MALTVRETQLLVAFIRAEQNMLEIWQIAELLRMDVGALNKPALELHIVRLRKKLTAIGTCAFPIKAIRGRGYQLCFPLVVGNPV